jgi:hypothetical protein
LLALSVAWQAYAQDAPHLYITAAIALLFKAVLIPVVLHRMIVKLGIHREVETVVGIGPTMLLGMGLVALSMVVMLRVTTGADPLVREDLAFSLSVVLLGLLMMVTTAECGQSGRGLHVARERARACRRRRQGHAVRGRDQRRLLHRHCLHRHRHFPVPHSRALRQRRCRGTRQLPRRTGMSFDAVTAILAIPATAALLLAILPGYKRTAYLNVLAAFLSFLAALSLFFFERPAPGPYILVDDLNNVFIVLTTFVGFTTSVFSASYIEHELEIGRLTPTFLRFYHAMYQVLMFALNLALVTNNIGVMWVAIELATLTTVMMVGIYRTHEALEAAWGISFSAASASRSRCSAPFSSTWRPSRPLAKA